MPPLDAPTVALEPVSCQRRAGHVGLHTYRDDASTVEWTRDPDQVI